MVVELVEVARDYLYRIIIAVVFLLVGFIFGLLIKKLLHRFLKEIELNKILEKAGINVKYDVEKSIGSLISYLIYFLTIVLVLDQLGIKSIVLYLFVGAIFMLIILTVLVGLKDVIPNFIGWIFLMRNEKKIKEGKKIEIKEISGTVEKISCLETEIKTDLGDILYIPNSLFLKSKFKVKKE